MRLEKFKVKSNKKLGIIIFTICCVVLIAGVYFYSSFAIYEQNQNFDIINGTVEDPGDLYFAFYVDDEISKTMPSKDSGYTLDTEKSFCTNGAIPSLNQENWSIKVNNLTTTYTKCTLYFKKYIPTAVETILAMGETDELKYDGTNDNNLRYVGVDPNNYVSFNNELWRIIGVMNNIDDGTGKLESRLKLVRSENYSSDLAWDTNNSADWSKASLNTELNTNYFNSISSPYQEMIGNAVWNLGAVVDRFSSTSHTSEIENLPVNQWYASERGTDTYGDNPTSWLGKLALVYSSDIGYATSGGTTGRDTCLNKSLFANVWSDSTDCHTNDWLFLTNNMQWTLTPCHYIPASDNHYMYVFVQFANGLGEGSVTQTVGVSIYPAFYLVSSVKIIDGTGSKNDPYIFEL